MKKNAFLIISIFIIASVHAEIIQHSLSACLDSPAIALKSSYPNADYYIWTDSVSTTNSYLFNPLAEGQFSFGVHAYGIQIDTANNLMANGSFEDGYTGFESDFHAPEWKNNRPQKVLDPENVYSNDNYWMYTYNTKNYGKHYAISSDASKFWKGDHTTNGYYPIKAQNGKYFLVVDASDEGYAWRTRTEDNPNLIIEKGKTYLFSCWVAFPNRSDQFGDPIAQLQFYIGYRNGAAEDKMQPLGDVFSALPLAPGQKPGDISETERYKWRQHYVVWTADFTTNEAVIGVKNVTKYEREEDKGRGNDFCLDNIVFQSFDSVPIEIVVEDSFIIDVKDCCVPISANDGKLRVEDIEGMFITYQWYCNGFAIGEATSSEHTIPLKNQNDLYYCIMTDAESNIYTSCKASYTQLTPIQEIRFNRHPAARRMRYQFGQLMVEEITYDDGSVEYRKIIQK